MSSGLTLEKLKAPLEQERDHLQRAKQVIQEQLNVLRAEEVTIHRLIQAHENGAGQQAPLGSAPLTAGTSSDSIQVDAAARARDLLLGVVIEPLPELQLDLAGERSSAVTGPGHRSGDEEEEEEEMDED